MVFCVLLLCAALVFGGCAGGGASSLPGPGSVVSVPPTSDFQEPVSMEGLPLPADFTLEGYELVTIDRAEYTNGELKTTLETLPATPAEQALCNFLLVEITGEFDRWLYLWPSGGFTPELVAEYTEEFPAYARYSFIAVHNVRELAAADAAAVQLSEVEGGLFQRLYDSCAEMGQSYEAYVETLYALGARAVFIDLTDQYTEAALSRGPQLSDGPRQEYYLLLPDQAGNMYLYARSVWGPF